MIDLPVSFKDKDPAADVTYQLDFDEWLAKIDPLTIVSIAWTVTPDAGDLTPLLVDAQQNAPDFSWSRVKLSAGTFGYRYRIRGAVEYSDGQSDVFSFALGIGYT